MPQSFEALMQKTGPKIYSLAVRLADSPADGNDLAQQTFVRAYRSFHHFRNESAFETRLQRICMNLWKNHIRSEKRRSLWKRLTLKEATPLGTLEETQTLQPPTDFYQEVRRRIARGDSPNERAPEPHHIPMPAMAAAVAGLLIAMMIWKFREPAEQFSSLNPLIGIEATGPALPQGRTMGQVNIVDVKKDNVKNAQSAKTAVAATAHKIIALEAKPSTEKPKAAAVLAKPVESKAEETIVSVAAVSPAEEEKPAENKISLDHAPIPVMSATDEVLKPEANAAATPASPSAEAVRQKTSDWQGSFSGIHLPFTAVIHDADALAALEQKHFAAGNKTTSSLMAWPTETLDFSKNTLLAIFIGDEPAAGYNILITETRMEADRVDVFYRVNITAPAPDAPAVITQPYLLKAIPHSDLPIVFHKLPS